MFFFIYQYFEWAHIVYNIYIQILHKIGPIKGNQYYLKNKTKIPKPISNDSNYFGKIYVIETEKHEFRIDRPFQFNRDLFKKAITKISLVILICDIKKAEANGYKKYTLQSNAKNL